MIQLSLSLGVLGRKNTEALQKVYLGLINSGYTHEQVEGKLLDVVQERYDKYIDKYCNSYMIFSSLKVAEDIVKELRQLEGTK